MAKVSKFQTCPCSRQGECFYRAEALKESEDPPWVSANIRHKIPRELTVMDQGT